MLAGSIFDDVAPPPPPPPNPASKSAPGDDEDDNNGGAVNTSDLLSEVVMATKPSRFCCGMMVFLTDVSCSYRFTA